MFLSPKKLIEDGYITHPDLKTIEDWEPYLTPNALDFTLDTVYLITNTSFLIDAAGNKKMRNQTKIEPQASNTLKLWNSTLPFDADKAYWKLDGNMVYDCSSRMHVTVPPNVASWLIIRSTFNRNGIFLTSGLYDSSFDGSIGFCLHNRSDGFAFIEPGTRIGQIMFVPADMHKEYEGGWNTEIGKHWKESTDVKNDD